MDAAGTADAAGTLEELARARERHIINELGFQVTLEGDTLRGSAPVVSEMFVPGTTRVRASILATWTDVASGLLAVNVFAPRVPVTLDLDLHVHGRPRELQTINATARLIKTGRSVVVASVSLTGDDGEDVAMGTASFMAAPNPSTTMPRDRMDTGSLPRQPGRLRQPFAERARCEVRAPGLAVLPRSEDGLNAANTINGGLIALVIEEAALSLTPGATLSSLSLRYLRAVRLGPAIATAELRGPVGRVEVRDGGTPDDDRLAVFAVTRAEAALARAGRPAGANGRGFRSGPTNRGARRGRRGRGPAPPRGACRGPAR